MTKKSELLIISKNSDGFLQRIMSLFYKRGYTIHKLNADLTNNSGYAQVTLTLEGDEDIFNILQKQVYKIVDVVKVQQI